MILVHKTRTIFNTSATGTALVLINFGTTVKSRYNVPLYNENPIFGEVFIISA